VQEETPEGDRIRVRLRFDVEEEALQFALGYGAAVEAIEPVELRDKVRSAARELADFYGTNGV
jgi:predicted DNA-binding transcriptional regulator YafY